MKLTSMDTIKNLKWALRKQIKARIAKLSHDTLLKQSILAAKTISDLPEFKNAKTVGLYMNLPSGELPTDEIVKTCFNFDKKVYLPRVTAISRFNDTKRFEKQKSILHFLSIDNLSEARSLPERGRYKIREPEFKSDDSGSVVNDLLQNNEKLDILFVPGMAFSSGCERLGHGAGYYDDFIKRYNEKYHEKPLLIGLGLKEQLLTKENGEVLHMEEHDELLDNVVIADTVYSRR
ncbi:hypothetical protein HII12_002061 [Brettanomyces bruxellensis]|uniref:5-formyltetrahydrofolate cyclo-ligase n=1 Tax=Dekkera bruxellensis TaxID=5007 RepID=A0A8H6EWX8_DEKBR|nr:hypothetical protein HII12_002061 [Brettanomyces bruxellensis]